MAKQATGKSTAKAAAKPAAKKAAAAKKTSPRTKKTAAGNSIDPGQRHHMIAEAAYYIAEHRGFNGGDSVQDWLLAETEIDRRL